MEFGFTEAQEIFRREVRGFVEKELLPSARERAKQSFVPKEVIKRIGEMGLLGINIPEGYGGTPANWVSLGIATEELARGNFAEGSLLTLPLILHEAMWANPEEMRQEWLTPLVKGEKLVSFSNTEPGVGSDAAAITTRAIRKDDCYIISGEKAAISFGMQAEAIVVTAKTDPSAGARGVSLFLVPMNFPGVSRSAFPYSGCKEAGVSLTLDEVKLPVKHLLGKEGQGFQIIMDFFDVARVQLSLCCVGAASISLEETIEHAKHRTAFGKPIAKWEGVSFDLAEAATLLEAARMLCYCPLWLRDHGQRHSKETAMTKKWWTPRACARIIHSCMVVMGHVGYSEEYPLEQRLRDVIGFEFGDGTPHIQKIIIARELLGKEFLPY